MRLISVNEKKQKLNDYWLAVVERCENGNTVTSEMTNALAELNNPQIDDDIFKIWLEVFLGSLVDPSTKNFIKTEITAFVCDKVEWFRWLEVNRARLTMIIEFMVGLVKGNKKFGTLVWRFIFKYLDLAFNQPSKGVADDSDAPYERHAHSELKNFENIPYTLADYEFTNYKDFRTFIDCSLIKSLDIELTSSKDQYIRIKGEVKNCIEAMFERLPCFSMSADIYYGYREKARIRKGFFIDANKTQDFKNFHHIDLNDALDDFVINKLCDSNSGLSAVLKLNAKIVDFLSELVSRYCEASGEDIKANFSTYLDQYNLTHVSNYKVVLTNLFVLVKRNPAIETAFIDYFLHFMINLDSEVSSSKKSAIIKRKIDYCFRLFFAFINQKLGGSSMTHKNKDMFINYMLKSRMDQGRNFQLEAENIFNQIFGLFFDKIINLEKLALVQYLVLFVVSSELKPVLNPEFDSFKELFMHKSVMMLFDAKSPSKVKENVLCYMHSFLRAVKINNNNLFSILYYVVQLLAKVTKRITKQIKCDYPSVKSNLDFTGLKERARTDYLNHFNKGLFCRLLAFLSRSLCSFSEELKTHHMIELVSLFERYFVRYQSELEVLINCSQDFYGICCKLNKVIKDPKLSDLIEHSSFTVKREKNISSLSAFSEYYMTDSLIDKRPVKRTSTEPQSMPFTHGFSNPVASCKKLTLVNQISESGEDVPTRKKININYPNFLSPSPKSLYTSTISFHSKTSLTEQKRAEANIWDFELEIDPFKYTEAYFYQEFIFKGESQKNDRDIRKIYLQDTDSSLFSTPVLGKRYNSTFDSSEG